MDERQISPKLHQYKVIKYNHDKIPTNTLEYIKQYYYYKSNKLDIILVGDNQGLFMIFNIHYYKNNLSLVLLWQHRSYLLQPYHITLVLQKKYPLLFHNKLVWFYLPLLYRLLHCQPFGKPRSVTASLYHLNDIYYEYLGNYDN